MNLDRTLTTAHVASAPYDGPCTPLPVHADPGPQVLQPVGLILLSICRTTASLVTRTWTLGMSSIYDASHSSFPSLNALRVLFAFRYQSCRHLMQRHRRISRSQSLRRCFLSVYTGLCTPYTLAIPILGRAKPKIRLFGNDTRTSYRLYRYPDRSNVLCHSQDTATEENRVTR